MQRTELYPGYFIRWDEKSRVWGFKTPKAEWRNVPSVKEAVDHIDALAANDNYQTLAGR
jgi:hypothetical protein